MPSLSPATGSSAVTESASDAASRKRRAEAEATSFAPKRKKNKESSQGRLIPRLVDLTNLANLRAIIRHSDAYEEAKAEGGLDFEDADEEKCSERMLETFTLLREHVPYFDTLIFMDISEDELRERLGEIEDQAGKARNEDNLVIKEEIIGYLRRFNFSHLNLGTLDNLHDDERELRGWNHPITGYLLCPYKFDWMAPSIPGEIRDALLPWNDCHFVPAFYAGFTIDHSDLDLGFMRSPLLVLVWLRIFYAKKGVKCAQIKPDSHVDVTATRAARAAAASSMSLRSKERKPSIARRIGMNKVTGRSLAYSGAMLHFNLTSSSHWTGQWEGHRYNDLYDFLVDYFERPGEGETAGTATLQWWNDLMFPAAHANTGSSNATSSAELAANRERRRARELAAANHSA